MSDPQSDLPASHPSDELHTPEGASSARTLWHKAGRIFFNIEGLRAGWRLVVYFAVAYVFVLALGLMLRLLGFRITPGIFNPQNTIAGELLVFFALFGAAGIMAKLERRSLAHYALPARGAFGRRFWEGILWGFVALSALILVIALGGGFAFRGWLLGGRLLFYYGSLWALAFLSVAFSEEFLMRGYTLFTMTRGIGFWPSAVVLSSVFGAIHLGNSGESWAGALSAASVGMFFCLTVRRTGSLWFAIGFHAAWDYAQSFIYSVPDSGIMVPGHLMDSSFHGPAWLSGGKVGPEGSVFAFVLIGLLCLVFHHLYPDAHFPLVPTRPHHPPVVPSPSPLDATTTPR